MFQQTLHTQTVNAPADAVWSHVRTGADVNLYIGMIETCRLDGRGVGARRTCTTADGPIRERIEAIDDETRTFQYTITEVPMPIRHILGTIRVRALDAVRSEVRWSLNYEVGEADAAPMDELIRAVYADAIRGLERLATAPVTR